MASKQDRIKLLLVDDEVEFLDSTARALERRGFKVERAPDAETALRLARLIPFDVAVLDVKMEGMSGIELLKRLRARWPGFPVIMLTGHGTVHDAFDASRMGAVEYLTKPLEVEILASTAREAVARSVARRPPNIDETGDEIRVLLVDDDTELLESLARVLERRHMRVTTAAGGAEAITILEDGYHDVVVLDVKMPGMDGLEVLRSIKERSSKIEVLLLTGHPSVHNAFEGVRSGAFDYLLKPHSVEDLVKMIRAAYRHRWVREEVAG